MSTLNTYTLRSWINEFQNEKNRVNIFGLRSVISKGTDPMIFMDETVLAKYHNELEQYRVSVTLTTREKEFYAYNPRLFAHDMYGIPEMWFLILYANELHSAVDFYLNTVKFYNPSISNVLNSIRNVEKHILDENAERVSDIVVNRKQSNANIHLNLY